MSLPSHDFEFAPQINLSRDPQEPPLEVGMEAFFEFSFWMAEELVDLVAEYECLERRRQENRQNRMRSHLALNRLDQVSPKA